MSDYSFIKEVVKEKPFDKKAFFIRVALLAAGAFLFGLIAAFTFASVLPAARKSVQGQQESPQVNFDGEEPPDNDGSVSAVDDEEEEEDDDNDNTQVIEVPAELGLSDYKQFYQDMVQASQNAAKSVVTVIGITDNMDWFNNTYENQRQISGLIIANTDQELYVLTEYRGVESVDRIQVIFWNNTTVDARFQKNDPSTGLCVLKIPVGEIEDKTRGTLVTAPLGSSYGAHQGDPIMALGSPMGYSNSIAFGMLTSVSNKVSALDTEYTLLTTDILGTKEGSGILLNLDGEIIGIILQNYSSSSNMVTCIAVSEITELMEMLSNNQELPYIGIRGQEVTKDISEKTGIPKGIYITEAQVDSPAMLAGFMSGDVIVKVKEQDVATLDEYSRVVQECKGGDVISVTVMRKGAEGYTEIVFDVTVGAL